MIIDLWYGHKKRDIAALDVYFYPNDSVYRGNFYDITGKIIGDYSTADSVELERTFPKLVNFGD